MFRDETGVLTGLDAIISYIFVRLGIIEHLRSGSGIRFPRYGSCEMADV